MAQGTTVAVILVVLSTVLATPLVKDFQSGQRQTSVLNPFDNNLTEEATDYEPQHKNSEKFVQTESEQIEVNELLTKENREDEKQVESAAHAQSKATSIRKTNEKRVDYTGAQVLSISTTKTRVRSVITRLLDRNLISTWGENQRQVHVLVKYEALNEVTRILKIRDIPYEVRIQDVQKLIDVENPPLTETEIKLQGIRGHRMTWKNYHRVDDIYDFLEYLENTYPSIVSVESIGKSYEGRDIKLIRISNGEPENKAVFIDGGIHAREWISPATVTYFINEIIKNFDEETDEFKSTDWYIVPVLNPDGYEHTHEIDRYWRKNRKPVTATCVGTDLNRNFGYKWGGAGASPNPCSDIFRGKEAFSEPESKSLSDFIKNSGVKFFAYLTYHSYGQYLLYPWGYDNVLPPDYKELNAVGKEVAKAIETTGGDIYQVGSSGILLYPAAGGSDDWAKSEGVKYSYTIELSDTGKHGFELPAEYIIPVATESLAGLRVFVKNVHKT